MLDIKEIDRSDSSIYRGTEYNENVLNKTDEKIDERDTGKNTEYDYNKEDREYLNNLLNDQGIKR